MSGTGKPTALPPALMAEDYQAPAVFRSLMQLRRRLHLRRAAGGWHSV